LIFVFFCCKHVCFVANIYVCKSLTDYLILLCNRKGEEWYRLRKISQQALLNSNNVNNYIPATEEITNDLVNLIRCERDKNKEMSDFEYDLYKWSLENVNYVCMDMRMGCLQPNLPTDSEARKLIRSSHEVIEAVHATEIGQTDLWRYFPTKMYRQLCNNQDIMADIVKKYLHEKLVELAERKIGKEAAQLSADLQSDKLKTAVAAAGGITGLSASETILAQYFNTETDTSFGDLLGCVLDLILAGIDTTSFSAGFVIYYLAKNPDKQEKLRQEIRMFFPDKSTRITPDVLTKMSYMRACVKEAMRLSPLAVGVGRVTLQDTVIRNYRIPPGVMVITHNQVMSRSEEYFNEPDKFMPERWIVTRKERPNPFVSLPFGFGPRSCPGRRVADMNTYVLLIQLLRNFNIEYHYEDIGVVTRLINIPDKAMQFRFNDIEY
jgi:hypothetical protein